MAVGTVRKLRLKDPESPWIFTYTDPETRKRVQITPKDGKKKTAQALQAEITARIVNGTHVAASGTKSFSLSVTAYIEHCKVRHDRGQRMAGGTLNLRSRQAKLIVPDWIKHKALTEINHGHLQRLVDEFPDHLAAATVRSLAGLVGSVMAFCVKSGWIKINPLRDNPLMVPARQNKKQAPSKAQIRSLLATLATREQPIMPEMASSKTGPKMRGWGHHTYRMRVALVSIALFTTMRRGEILGLRWADVDFATNTLRVRHSYSRHDKLKDPKTLAGIREIPMAPQVRMVLENLASLYGSEPNRFVLTGTAKGDGPIYPDAIYVCHWKPMMRAAGLVDAEGKSMFTLHQLRHASISILIEQGLDAFQIMKIAGHSSISVTMNVYGHLFPEDKRARNAIEAASTQFVLDAAISPPLLEGTPLKVAIPGSNRVGQKRMTKARAPQTSAA